MYNESLFWELSWLILIIISYQLIKLALIKINSKFTISNDTY
jgi:hypothetical protein